MGTTNIDRLNIKVTTSAGNASKSIRSLASALEKLGSSSNKGISGLSKIESTMDKINSATGRATNSTKGLSSIFSKLKNPLSSSSSGLGKFSSSAKSSGGILSGFIDKLYKFESKLRVVKFAITAVSGAISTVFEESTSYTETLNLFNVAMGESAQSSKAFAESLQAIMGIDSAEFMNYQAVFANMLNGYGVANDKMKVMSQNLTQLAYDYSSLMNVQPQEAFEKLNSAMSGQVKGLKEYGNNVSVAMVKQTGLKYGLEGSVSSWDNATQATMRYITIMENAANTNVFNDMARTIVTPANATRILSAAMTQLKRAIGNIASVFISKLIPAITAFVQVTTRAAQALANFFGFELPSIDYSSLGSSSLADDTEDAEDNLGGANEQAQKLKKTLMGFDELNVIQEPTTSNSSGSGSSGSGKSSIGDIELPQYDFFDQLAKGANKSIDEIMAKLKEVFRPVSESWAQYGQSVVDSFKEKWSAIGTLVSAIGKSFNDVWNNGTGKQTLDYIFQIIISINNAVRNLANNFTIAWRHNELGTSIIQNLWNILNSVLGTVQRIVSATEKWAVNINFEPLLRTINGILGALGKLVDILGGALASAFENVVLPFVGYLIEHPVTGIVGALGIEFLSLGSTLSGLSGIFGSVGSMGSSMFKLLTSGAGGLIPSITTLGGDFGALAELVGEATTGGGAFEALSAFLPELASGFLTTIGPILAVVAAIALVVLAITQLWDESETFRNDFTSLIDSIKSIVSELWDNILKPIVDSVIEIIKSLWNDCLSPIWDNVKELVASIIGLIADLLDVFKPFIDFFINNFGAEIKAVLFVLQTIFKTVFSVIGNVINVFLNVVKNVISSVRQIFGGLVDFIAGVFTGNWSRAWNGVKNVLSGIWNGIVYIVKAPVNAVIGIVNGLINGIEWAVNRIASALNSISVDIPDWVPGIGGRRLGFNLGYVSLGRIGYLAKGGIVDEGQLFVANEKGPELVGTMNNSTTVANNTQIIEGIKRGVYEAMREAGSGEGNSSPIEIVLKSMLDGREIGKSFVKYHNGVVKQTGATPLAI